MRTRTYPLTSLVVAAAVITALSQAPPLAADQRGQGDGAQANAPAQGGQRGRANAPQPPAGPVPRLANGKPDLSGLWNNPYSPNMAGRGLVDPKTREPLKFARQGEALPDAAAPASGNTPRTYDLPYTEWGLNQWKKYDPVANGDYAGNCLPFGLSRNINSPHGVQIVHSPDALAFLFEQNTWHHLGAAHPGLQVACRPAGDLERLLHRALGGRHPHHGNVGLQWLHQARHLGASAQQTAEADQHLPPHRLQHDGAHGHRVAIRERILRTG